MNEDTKNFKHFGQVLKHTQPGDTISISYEDLRAAIIQLREETMVKTAAAERERIKLLIRTYPAEIDLHTDMKPLTKFREMILKAIG